MPSTGVDRRTGVVISGLDHVRQSVEVIFTTAIGSRVLRRTFGSRIPGLLMRENLTPEAMARFFFALTVAIDLWEPRLQVTRVFYPAPPNVPSTIRMGAIAFAVLCSYRPEALSGDTTSDVQAIYL